MSKLMTRLRLNRGELLVNGLRCVLYGGMCLLFFGLMAVENWPLRHLSRTLATTLLTWWITTLAMRAVYGGYDIGRRKSKPIISGLVPACLLTDLITFLQLQIMNTNANANAHLTLFGTDALWLLLCMALQVLLIIGMVRGGNALYFRIHRPRRCLLVLASPQQEAAMREKIGRYRLQWTVTDVALCSDPDLEQRVGASEAVFLAELPEDTHLRLLRLCYQLRRDCLCKAQLQDIMLACAQTVVIDDAPFLEMAGRKTSFTQRAVKRAGDIVVSAAVLLLFSPLMALIALAIRLSDGGPALYRQQRLTVDGRRFTILKFRTMRAEDGEATLPTQQGDSRVTRLGSLLRCTRLDELPQLWNILQGDMSLVGPRPEMIANVERYKLAVPTFVYRERMKAGLTGYAQIEGRYNTTPEDKLMLDLLYIENFSLWLDVQLLFRTLTVLLKPDSTEGFEDPLSTVETDKKEC